jgi:hypothetical protein
MYTTATYPDYTSASLLRSLLRKLSSFKARAQRFTCRRIAATGSAFRVSICASKASKVST